MNRGSADNPARCSGRRRLASHTLPEPSSPFPERLGVAKGVRETTLVGPTRGDAPAVDRRARIALVRPETDSCSAEAVRPARWAGQVRLAQKIGEREALHRGSRATPDTRPAWIVTQQPPACRPAVHAASAGFLLAFTALDVGVSREVVHAAKEALLECAFSKLLSALFVESTSAPDDGSENSAELRLRTIRE